MTLLVLGINHKTASVALRERMLFSPEHLAEIFSSLAQVVPLQGVVPISTCNRAELYLQLPLTSDEGEGNRCGGQFSLLVEWWCQYHGVSSQEVVDHLYCYQDNGAVCHLMRVASGLDSMVIGENQILGQVKKAYLQAQRHHTLAPDLDRLFQKVFYVAKLIRSRAQFGGDLCSIPKAICRITRKVFGDPQRLSVLLIGAGEAISEIATLLHKHQVGRLLIANRTREKAEHLAQMVDGSVVDLQDLASNLANADVVISSTSSPIPIITEEIVRRASTDRLGMDRAGVADLLLFDLAVPRDIEPAVGELSGVRLYTLDNLSAELQKSLSLRSDSALRAEKIVEQEGGSFTSWLWDKCLSEHVCNFFSQARYIQNQCEAHALEALERGEDAEVVIRKMAHKLTQQLSHLPIPLLKRAAQLQRDGILPKRLEIQEIQRN